MRKLILLFVLLATPAWGVIAHVQTPSGGAAGSGTDLPSAFGSNVTAGNSIVCCWRHGGNGRTVTLSDGLSNVYVSSATSSYDGVDGSTTGIGYALNINGGACTPNLHITGASTTLRFSCSEFSGVSSSSALDKTASTNGSSNAPASGAVTPSIDGELLYACTHIAAIDTFTAGTDFTINTTVIATAGSQRLASERYIQPTAASHNGNFSTTNSNTWTANLVTLTAAGGATFPAALINNPLQY